MEFQITETLTELETRHSALRRRIDQTVEAASKGENDGTEINSMIREAADLRSKIENAKLEGERAEHAKECKRRDQVALDLPEARNEALAHRTAFLDHYREACISLGLYLQTMSKATRLTNATATNFGISPENSNALRVLDLGQMPHEVVGDLKPDLDGGWKMSYSVRPMYQK